MCRICAEWQMGKLTTTEAWRNLNEMPRDTEEELVHFFEVAEKLSETDEENEP